MPERRFSLNLIFYLNDWISNNTILHSVAMFLEGDADYLRSKAINKLIIN